MRCIECNSAEDVHQKLQVCRLCIHAWWLLGPGRNRSGEQGGSQAKVKPTNAAKPVLNDEEIKRYRRDLNVIPGKESAAYRR